MAIGLAPLLVSLLFAATSTTPTTPTTPTTAAAQAAQAGSPCAGTVCGLGGQIRNQIGGGLPLPISLARAQTAAGPQYTPLPFTAITIQTAPATPFGFALPFVGSGLGQTGQIKPTPSATIMQTLSPGIGPRQLTIPPAVFQFRGQGSLGVAKFNLSVFAVQTRGVRDFPHPGTTASGAQAFTERNQTAAIPTLNANVLFAGGRIGAPTVTYYANATASGSPTNNYGHGVPPTVIPTDHAGLNGSPPIHGVARFTATGNQFGGQAIGRTTGTTRIYLNGANGVPPLSPPADLPCKVTATALEGTTAQGIFVPFNTGANCQFWVSVVDPVGANTTVGITGGAFNGVAIRPDYQTNTGAFTGTIGFNGTILGQGLAVTAIGAGIPFTGEGNQTVGFPMTTGRLTISVSHTASGTLSEMFIRKGTDARDAAGNGVVALVTGSLTARDAFYATSSGRTWITLEIPEPSAIAIAASGLFALFACHQLVGGRRP